MIYFLRNLNQKKKKNEKPKLNKTKTHGCREKNMWLPDGKGWGNE